MFQGTNFKVEFRILKCSIDKKKIMILLNLRSISFIGNRSLFFITPYWFNAMKEIDWLVQTVEHLSYNQTTYGFVQ